MAAVNWNYIAQAQQLLSKKFADKNYKVIYVEPLPVRFGSLQEFKCIFTRVIRMFHVKSPHHFNNENLHIIPLIGLPEKGPITKSINSIFFLPLNLYRIRKKMDRCLETVIECWKPLDIYYQLINKLGKNNILVYSCIDNYSYQFKAPRHLIEIEKKMVQDAEGVIAIADYVASRLKAIRNDIFMRDAAVDYELFNSGDNGPFKEIKNVCFFGAISERINFKIINMIANKGIKTHLIGPIKRLPQNFNKNLKNIILTESVPYEQLPVLLKSMDIFIFPYMINEYTKGIRLAKLYECFATGKPIVGTNIPSFKKYSDLIANDNRKLTTCDYRILTTLSL